MAESDQKRNWNIKNNNRERIKNMENEIYIEIPTRSPKIWGISKIIMCLAFAVAAAAFILMSETLAIVSVIMFGFLYIYSEDFRRLFREY